MVKVLPRILAVLPSKLAIPPPGPPKSFHTMYYISIDSNILAPPGTEGFRTSLSLSAVASVVSLIFVVKTKILSLPPKK